MKDDKTLNKDKDINLNKDRNANLNKDIHKDKSQQQQTGRDKFSGQTSSGSKTSTTTGTVGQAGKDQFGKKTPEGSTSGGKGGF